MQSMFRLPWSTECDKAFPKSRPGPVVDIPLLSQKLKRKRTDSPEPSSPASAQLVKKSKCARGEVEPVLVDKAAQERPAADKLVVAPIDTRKDSATPSEASTTTSPAVATVAASVGAEIPVAVGNSDQVKLKTESDTNNDVSTTDMESCMTPLQQAIEAQFNLEILLKHNELRLIEQELAKAQIALEQLRRCSVIPYPGTEGLHMDVSNGVGPALRPQQGYTEPKHATPWGVADGPYARHYAKWLIPDPRFDSVPYASLHHGANESRSIRASFTENAHGMKSRTSRTSGNAKLPYMPDLAPATPKVDPLLHKRSTDGAWVRLYCHTCGHSNFSNTQGFLNHCRIKHQQIFKSHDQAAIACGIEVDSNEAGAAAKVAEAQVATPSVPSTPSACTATPTPSLAHPLIRSNDSKGARALPPRPMPGTLSTNFPAATGPATAHGLTTPNTGVAAKGCDYFSTPMSAPPQSISAASFTPSPQTPYINSILAKSGWSGDLSDIVDKARTKVDLSAIEFPVDEDSAMQSVPQSATSEVASHSLARGSSKKGGMAPASQRPMSQKGQPKTARSSSHHTPEALDLTATPSLGNSDMRVIPESPVEMSPHGIESNPGLVSDHDDDDDEDDARSIPHLDHDGDCVMDHDVAVEDGSDNEAERRKGIEGFRKAATPTCEKQ